MKQIQRGGRYFAKEIGIRQAMHSHRIARCLFMAIFTMSFVAGLRRKALNKESAEMTVASLEALTEALSKSIFQLAKRDKGSHLPARVHLTVVVPTNSFVGAKNFNLVKVFVGDLVREFSISPSGTRVAMVTQSFIPRLEFSWYKFMNTECTLKGISSVRFQAGNRSSLNTLLTFAKSKMYSPAKNTTDSVHRVLFIITESIALNASKITTSLAKELQNDGVDVFLLTVGKNAIMKKPNMGISKPFKGRVFRVKSFRDLPRLAKSFKGKGLNRSCSTEGFAYDECNRRCLCKKGSFTDCYRIRKDFMEMPLEERRRYVGTLKVVSTKEPYKKTYDLITRLHPKFFDVIHERTFFFPWHRWYLFIFENLLRHVDCRLTVPYWNWARAVSRNRLWRATDIRDIWNPGPHGLGGDGEGGSRTSCVRNGPFQAGKWSLPEWLFSECLSRRFDHRYYLPSEEYVKDLNKLPWSKFRKFESGVRRFMHNDLHNAVGGTMSEDESASAPEFWSHHAFLDKIWSDWQDHGSKYKFAYYKRINVLLPGGNHFGWQFMDLQSQPHCIRILYEEPKSEKVPDGADDNGVRYNNDVDGDEDEDDDGNDNDDDDNNSNYGDGE